MLALTFPQVSIAQDKPAQPSRSADEPKQAIVIESYVSTVQFENSGAFVAETAARIRIQSQSAIESWGVLRFPYAASTMDQEIIYVRVMKPDGTVVSTPAENTLDMPAEVTQKAPFYSDLKEKQVAVKGLDIGDAIEYRARTVTHTSLVPGQFWYEYDFFKDVEVLREELQVSVPADRALKLHSSTIQPLISEAKGRRLYLWKYSNPASKLKESQNQPAAKIPPPPDVLLSTFKSWDEVGQWFLGLASPRIAPTAAIRTKALELTRGLSSDEEKARALYAYVSAKIRYIGVAFGIGRFQPHAAEEVLANGYGDCKDKHTLLASLLAASEIKSYPALINTDRKIDPDVPSPAQFNHVITMIPKTQGFLWLDTTSEVAPFGLLLPIVRGKLALPVLDSPGRDLVKVPQDPPFPSLFNFQIAGKLDSSGTFQAKVQATLRGDTEVLLRAAFRSTSPAQWTNVVQNISRLWGFGGTVSDVSVTSAESTEQPLQISYDYTRTEYSDWSNHRISPPLPPLLVPELEKDSEKSPEPIPLEAPGEYRFEATVELPEGSFLRPPERISAKNAYADYGTEYSFSGTTLHAFRRLTIHASEIPPTNRPDYLALRKALLDDQDRMMIVLNPKTLAADLLAASGEKNPEVLKLIADAQRASQAGDRLGALNLLKHAVEIAPDSAMAFKVMGFLLMSMGRFDEAVEAWRGLARANPDDGDAQSNMGIALLALRRFPEAITQLELASRKYPNSANIVLQLGMASARMGNVDKAMQYFQRAWDLDPSTNTLNSIAYELAEDNLNLDRALKYAQQAVQEEEEKAADITLQDVDAQDMRRMSTLAAYWDTLGWVQFRLGHFKEAQDYLNAAWNLAQFAVGADHLGQVLEKEGNPREAAHLYALAIAAGHAPSESHSRLLRILGDEGKINREVGASREELGHLRSAKIPRPDKDTKGSAEFLLLFAPDGKIQDVKFIEGKEEFRPLTKAISSAKFSITLAPDTRAKLVRRGLLVCEAGAAPCDLVLLTPDMALSPD